jgi:hypothetical protein
MNGIIDFMSSPCEVGELSFIPNTQLKLAEPLREE